MESKYFKVYTCKHSKGKDVKSPVNRCGTQCKWNDLNQKDSSKSCNTVWYITSNLLAIEWAGSNWYLSKIAKILLSRSSSGGLPLRISHAGLDGRAVSLQSRIRLFEIDKHVQQTVLTIWVQFGWHQLFRSREIWQSLSAHTSSQTFL
jgi:hypothetical protein